MAKTIQATLRERSVLETVYRLQTADRDETVSMLDICDEAFIVWGLEAYIVREVVLALVASLQTEYVNLDS